MKQLTLLDNAGQFVHDSQKMAKEQNFACVSKAWYDKTISYDEALDKLIDQKRQRNDLLIPIEDVRIDLVDNKLVLNTNGIDFSPTEHALKQIANWLDVPQTMLNHYSQDKEVNGKVKFKRDERDLDLLKTAFELGRSRLDPKKEFLFRTYTDNSLRAMLSDSYACVDNEWYLNFLKDNFPDGRVSHYNFSDCDTVHFNTLFPDTMKEFPNEGDFGLFINCQNSEIGIARLSQRPSVFRAICANGCVWGQNKGEIYTRIHRGMIDLVELEQDLKENIAEQLPLAAALIDQLLSTRQKKLTSPVANLLAQLSLDNKLSTKQTIQIADEYTNREASGNLFGIINAITRAGQLFNRETWFEFDRLGGSLASYSDKQWSNLQDRARMLSMDDVKSVFGIGV